MDRNRIILCLAGTYIGAAVATLSMIYLIIVAVVTMFGYGAPYMFVAAVTLVAGIITAVVSAVKLMPTEDDLGL